MTMTLPAKEGSRLRSSLVLFTVELVFYTVELAKDGISHMLKVILMHSLGRYFFPQIRKPPFLMLQIIPHVFSYPRKHSDYST
jgi:hypothetical protein